MGVCVNGALEEYVLQQIEPEPAHLRRLVRRAHLQLTHPQMLSGHLQGRFLKMLVRMIRPREILEIGTYGAYATLSMAEALSEQGRITTIEVFEEIEEFINQAIQDSGFEDKVNLIIGNALQVIPQLDLSKVDLVYIDGNKRQYVEYTNAIVDRLNVGAFIIADNTLWYGKVIDSEGIADEQTLGIKAFNEYVRSSECLEQVIVPIRDGISLICKTK